MRVNKIPTTAFAISGDSESHFLDSIKSSSGGNFDLEKGYIPLVVCNATGDGRNKGYSNKFFISLTTGDIYLKHHKGYADSLKGMIKLGSSVETPELSKSDLLMKLKALNPDLIKEYGKLMEGGTLRIVDLDQRTLANLKQLIDVRFAEVYTHQVTEYVKPLVKIPPFTSPEYDLSKYFDVVHIVDDSYPREHLVYTPQTSCILLSLFFDCKVSVEGILYMPYMTASYSAKGHTESETQVTAFPKKLNHKLKRYEHASELKPLMVGVKGDGLDATPLESSILNFSNVSGMDKVKENLMEAIIYPLTNPKLSKEFGQKMGGGILFYGPPGCGKTFIVRATVGEAGVNFFSVNVQDIIGGDPNAGAKKLHDAFEEARNSAPAVLFFDEIDALSGKREAAQSSFERMVINQFLTEMDGLSSVNENVLVIGATNIPWGVDPALRRAGRFTAKVYIPPPDREARKSIFKASLKGKPIEGIDFDKLAELTEGYSSADISAIAVDASKIPWEESLKGMSKRSIGMGDFMTVLKDRKSSLIAWFNLARKELEASGEMELYKDLVDYTFKMAGGVDAAKKQDIDFSHVGGMTAVKEEIKKKIVYPFTRPDLAKEFGRTVGGGIMLYGPPGCGKTYIARAAAGECKAAFFNIKLTDIISSDEAETQKHLHSIFDRATRSAPAILFFDEIDAIAGKRSSESGSSKRLVNQMLTEMDGFEKRQGLMILAATNSPWDIDPALRRPGRFTDQIFIPSPDLESRKAIFQIRVKGKPIDESVSMDELAKLTENYSSADITAICEEADAIPWEESLKGMPKRKVSMNDFLTALKKRKPSILAWYMLAEKQLEKSGEKDLYAALLKDIEASKGKGDSSGSKKVVSGENAEVLNEKSLVEHEIGILKKKYSAGEISEDVFKELLKEYEKKLIEIEVKLS